jgi:hypothetical protein
MPALSLATIVALLLPAEVVARKTFTESTTSAADCLVVRDPVNGIHGIPNSTCYQKPLEGHLVRYTFNSCGNRAGMDCGPKPPDTYRIVLLGTSVAEGLHTDFNSTIASRLPAELSQITGKNVQVYDEGIMYGTPHLYDLRFRYVLAEQPDLILWTITKWDIDHVNYVDGAGEFKNNTLTGPPRPKVAGGLLAVGFFPRALRFAGILLRSSPSRAWTRLTDELNAKFRCVFVLKHFLYESQTQYLKYYLMQGAGAEFLRTRPGMTWQHEMQVFDRYAADIEAKARAAGVPLVATAIPERAVAVMVSSGSWPNGYDPYKFGSQVQKIIESHGGTYIDVTHGFRSIPHPERLWLPVDRHPTAQGHAVLSELMAKALTDGCVPALQPANILRSSAGGAR